MPRELCRFFRVFNVDGAPKSLESASWAVNPQLKLLVIDTHIEQWHACNELEARNGGGLSVLLQSTWPDYGIVPTRWP